MTLGQEFHGWSVTLGKDVDRMEELAKLFSEVNLGGTAIGTGINTDPDYTPVVMKKLALVTEVNVSTASNLGRSHVGHGRLFALFGNATSSCRQAFQDCQ